jgi:hypothetical protein
VNNNYNSNTVVKQDFAVVKQVDGRAAHMIDTTQHQSWQQCFHNRSFKNPFTISKIPFFPQNFLATQTAEKIKKIQAI